MNPLSNSIKYAISSQRERYLLAHRLFNLAEMEAGDEETEQETDKESDEETE